MKILQICKSWGMTNPNDTRHWIADIEEELENERRKAKKEMAEELRDWVQKSSNSLAHISLPSGLKAVYASDLILKIYDLLK